MKTLEIARTIELGSFNNLSGVMRCSDPCYEKKVWCAGIVKCKTGRYHASTKIEADENRNAELIVVHEDYKDSQLE